MTHQARGPIRCQRRAAEPQLGFRPGLALVGLLLVLLSPLSCTVDNNGDRRGASSSEETETNCGDGIDDDGDGLIDCLDPQCLADPQCLGDDDDSGATTGGDDDDQNPEFDCANGLDDNGDGLIDCDDPDCHADPACGGDDDDGGPGDDDDTGGGSEDIAGNAPCDAGACPNCTDCIDNDGDGTIDCEDSDCIQVCEALAKHGEDHSCP